MGSEPLFGIGLHSYGFTQGIMNGLIAFYSIEPAVLLAGAFLWFKTTKAGGAVAASGS